MTQTSTWTTMSGNCTKQHLSCCSGSSQTGSETTNTTKTLLTTTSFAGCLAKESPAISMADLLDGCDEISRSLRSILNRGPNCCDELPNNFLRKILPTLYARSGFSHFLTSSLWQKKFCIRTEDKNLTQGLSLHSMREFDTRCRCVC